MDNSIEERELLKALESDSGGNINFQNIISFVWRLKWWMLLTLGVAMMTAFYYIKLQTPCYECKEKVMFIDEKSGSVELSVLAEVTGKGQKGSLIDDEIIIIKSPSLMTKVVNNLGLNVRYFQYRLPVFHSSFPLFRSLFNVKEYEFYNDAPFRMSLSFDPYYSETSRPDEIMLEFKVHGNDTYDLRKVLIGDKLSEYKGEQIHHYSDTLVFGSVKLWIDKMDSYSLIEKDVYKIEYCSPYRTAEMFSSRIRVALDRGISSSVTNMMNLSIIDNKTLRAEDILNTLVEEYNYESREYKSLSAVRSIQFIDERLHDISSELGNVESAYSNYQISHDFIEGGRNLIAGMQDFESQLSNINIQRTFLKIIKDELTNMNDGQYWVIPASVGLNDAGLNNLVSEFNKLVTERERLASNSSSNNPSVLKYDDKLKVAKKNLSIGVQSLERVFSIREKEILANAQDARRQRSFIPTRQLDLSKISRKQQIIEPLYIQLNQKREEMQLSMCTVTDNVRIIEAARSNPSPLSPNKKKIYMLAILLGLGIPIAVVFLRSILRLTVETKEDIKKRLSNPILSTIPKGNGGIIAEYGRDNSTESFRMLRSSLEYLQGKMIQVTSCVAGEGKSYVAVNLAISISHLRKRVALVGLDLRKPVLKKYFPDLVKETGQSVVGYLIGKVDDPAAVPVKYTQGESSLDVFFSGSVPPNPSELLSMGRLESLIMYLREHYDYVICDTTPFLPVSDSAIINKYMDLTFFVVRSDYTQLKLLDDMNEIIRNGHLKNVNIILNGMDMTARKYRYGYGYGYGYGHYGYGRYGNYGYGYGYGEEEEKTGRCKQLHRYFSKFKHLVERFK